MMLRTLALFLSLCAGCGGQLEYFHGDVTFTAEERAAIEEGSAFLAPHASYFPRRIEWDAPHVDGDCLPYSIRRDPYGMGGERGPSGGRDCIVIGAKTPARYLPAIAAHEMGHWSGLAHVGHGLMQPIPERLEWSLEDEDECQRVGCRD